MASSSSGENYPNRNKAGGATEHAFSDLASTSLGAMMPGRSNVHATRTPRSEMKFTSREDQLASEERNAQLHAQLAATVATQTAKYPPPPPPPPPVPHIQQVYRRSQVPPPEGGALEHRATLQLTTVDMATLDIITRFCATSPDAQHNGIAVTNRYFNIAWRRMHRNVARHMMRELLSLVHDRSKFTTVVHDRSRFTSVQRPWFTTFCVNGIYMRGYERQQTIEFICEDLDDILF